MAESDDPHPFALIGVDVVRAVAIARDQDNMPAVYRRVFGGVEGRAVLFDLLDQSQAMRRRRPDTPALERAHMDGMAAMAAMILDLAGVDELERVAGLQVAVTLTKHMERAHERPWDSTGDAGNGADTFGGGSGNDPLDDGTGSE